MLSFCFRFFFEKDLSFFSFYLYSFFYMVAILFIFIYCNNYNHV